MIILGRPSLVFTTAQLTPRWGVRSYTNTGIFLIFYTVDFSAMQCRVFQGSDCIEKFAEMQKCMQSYPELFEEKRGKFTDDEDDEEMAKTNKDTVEKSESKDAVDKDTNTINKDAEPVSPESEKDETAQEPAATPVVSSTAVASDIAEGLDAVQLADSNSESSKTPPAGPPSS